jgi:choline-sulfatase
VLLLMVDQLAARWLPAYGNAVARTPAIDRLAAAGAVFESAYCASPLCAPSRAAMLCGRPPSGIGVYDNAAPLAPDVPTLAHVLRSAGYATVLAGKMHFVGPDQLHGFEERLTTDVYPGGFEWTPDWSRPVADGLPWYHNVDSLLMAGVAEFAMQTDYDDEVTLLAVRRLGELAAAGDPFFFTVSLTNPHDPWEVRRRFWDLYDGVDVGEPRVGAVPRDRADAHSLRLRDMAGLDERPLTAEERARARRGYFAALSYADDRLGAVLDALDASGAAADTVVVLTADHGEMLGERGLWYKMSFFEPSAAVPLVLRGPGVPVARVGAPVSHLDLAPTLAALTGADAAGAGFEGTSLVPLLDGTGAGPDAVHAEYLAEGSLAPMVMVRRGRHKLVHCPGDPDLLFDLDADPDELDDLAGSPEHAGTLASLREEVAARWDLDALDAAVRASQRRRRITGDALARGAHTPWDFQPYVDATRRYVRGADAARRRPGEYPPGGGLPGA